MKTYSPQGSRARGPAPAAPPKARVPTSANGAERGRLPRHPGAPATPSAQRPSTLGGRLWSHRTGVAIALVATAFVVVGVVLTMSSYSSPKKYGGLPSWLPRSTLPVGRVVQASAGRPWVAIEGDTVLVKLSHGYVLATRCGPSRSPRQARSQSRRPARALSLSHLPAPLGVLPISAGAFSVEDEAGPGRPPEGLWRSVVAPSPGRHHPARASPSASAGPADRCGQLRWAPEGGTSIVSWDFDVEID